MGFSLDAFLVSISSNLLINIITTATIYILVFVAGKYGKTLIFNLKRPIYYISNKSIDLDYFSMSVVFRKEDTLFLDKIADEFTNKYGGRLIDDKKEAANTRVIDIESNKYIFEAKISFNPNVAPELEEAINDYSVTLNLRTKKLHYRDILGTIKESFMKYNGIIRGLVGNDLKYNFQVSIPIEKKGNALNGSINGVEVILDSKSLTMIGEMTPLFEVFKMSMVSKNLTIYKMIKGKTK
jgi:hypothetical protein